MTGPRGGCWPAAIKGHFPGVNPERAPARGRQHLPLQLQLAPGLCGRPGDVGARRLVAVRAPSPQRRGRQSCRNHLLALGARPACAPHPPQVPHPRRRPTGSLWEPRPPSCRHTLSPTRQGVPFPRKCGRHNRPSRRRGGPCAWAPGLWGPGGGPLQHSQARGAGGGSSGKDPSTLSDPPPQLPQAPRHRASASGPTGVHPCPWQDPRDPREGARGGVSAGPGLSGFGWTSAG